MKYNKEYQKPDGRKLISGGPRDIQRRQQQEGPSTGGAVDELRNQIKELTMALHQKPVIAPEDLDKELRKAVEEAVSETKAIYTKKLKALEVEVEELKSAGVLTSEKLDEEINKATIEAITFTKEEAAEDLKKLEDNLTVIINKKVNELYELNSKYEKLVINSDNEILRYQDKIDSLRDKIKDKDELILNLEKKSSDSIDINDERIAELVAQKIAVDSEGGVYDPNQPKMKTVFVDPSEARAEDKLEGNIETETIATNGKINVADKTEKLKSLIGKLPSVV